MSGPLTVFDKPNSYIGRAVPRADANRLLEGRGKYVDDLQLPRMVHAAFLRSPYAHARINGFDLDEARASPGVVSVYTGTDFVGIVQPYVGVLTHLAGLRSPPQMPLAVDTARWQGEPIAMVVAQAAPRPRTPWPLSRPISNRLPEACDAEAALDQDAW